eukprot:10017160-Ditylum_brightwellii.AAC.1
MAFDLRCRMFEFTIPCAVDLSTCIGVAGWGCPNSISAMHMGAASFAFSKRAPNSASAAEAITF